MKGFVWMEISGFVWMEIEGICEHEGICMDGNLVNMKGFVWMEISSGFLFIY